MQRELFGGAMTASMPEAFKDARYLLKAVNNTIEIVLIMIKNKIKIFKAF